MIIACKYCSHSATEHETGESAIDDINSKITFGHCKSPDCVCTGLQQYIGLNPSDDKNTFLVEVESVVLQRGNRYTEPVTFEMNGKELTANPTTFSLQN